MKINIRKLLSNAESTLARIVELREGVTSLHQLVGPGLKKFMDTHDFSFSTSLALAKFGDRLLKGAIIVQEAVEKLAELVEIDNSTESRVTPLDSASGSAELSNQ